MAETRAEAPPADAGASDETTRRAGRGVLAITAAKLYFIVAGYSVQLTLPRLLGSPELFGLYSSAMSVVSILNNALVPATVQTVSKRVSEDEAHARETLRQGLAIQLVIALALGSGFALAAPLLARQVLLDPLLSPLFRITALVLFSYAVYAALVGALNGRQRFGHQAALDATYTTLRTLGILGAAALGFGVAGALTGFAMASVGVLSVALLAVGIGQHGRRLPLSGWISFMAPLWLYQLCLNMTLQVDLTVLKRTVAELSMEAGAVATVAADTASRYAGFYRAAQTFAFVPYQVILSVTFVVFPMVSQATSGDDLETTRGYIRAAMRFSLIVLLAIAAPISGASAGVMRIAYPDAYLAGSSALSILSLGMVCFALFVIAATILSGAGKPGVSASIAAGAVAVVVVCNVTFVRAAGLGEHTLMAAASGTSVGTTLALVAAAITVHRRFGAFIAWPSAVRTLLAAGVGFSVARALPSDSALSSLVALVAGGLAYLATLLAVGELGRSELAALQKVLGRR